MDKQAPHLQLYGSETVRDVLMDLDTGLEGVTVQIPLQQICKKPEEHNAPWAGRHVDICEDVKGGQPSTPVRTIWGLVPA